MKNMRFLPILLGLLSGGMNLHAQQAQVSIHISKKGCSHPVVLKLPSLRSLKIRPKSAIVQTADGTRRTVACQLDDFDADGYGDELVFYSVPGVQYYTVTLSETRSDAASLIRPGAFAFMGINDKKGKYPQISHIEARGDSYLFSDIFPHGAAWESDQTAYRLYFDHRQNIDLYGKRQRRLELSDTRFYTTDQQLREGYGYDVLWAGSSIACGSLKLWTSNGMENWTQVGVRGMRIIASGPLRTVVELRDQDTRWSDNYENTVTARYTQYAHSRDVRVDIRADRPLAAGRLCTGVQRIAGSSLRVLENDGLTASWGADYPEQSNEKAKARFGLTSVGMAVYVPRQFISEIHEDSLNCLFILGKGKEMHYYFTFCSGIETWSGLNSFEPWLKYAREWAERCEGETEECVVNKIRYCK